MQFRDKNTKFFHKKASQRKQKNSIRGLQDSNGNWKSSTEDLQSIMFDFYTELFRAENIVRLENCCGLFLRKVTAHMCDDLLRPYTKEDVQHALHAMSPTKSPGLDGLVLSFIRDIGT